MNSIKLQKNTKKNENLNGFPSDYGALSFGCFKLNILLQYIYKFTI